ncbi:hypothetical protein [Pseudomonas amygdali]|uniref:hypothetical protein n=1 Tax=Pseudomonas amygdali TaxID=47877 RepID=UPI000EFF5A41|nr:hypothetical protein [Pseudomonas amygdali]RMV48576.1 hypothetical protein ALP09_04093 [Pseudomonas amygdali pv. lachrymans]
MGRRVDTSWYGTYLEAIAFGNLSGDKSVGIPEVADHLGVKPKTLARIMSAGRFIHEVLPMVRPEQIQCGYASLELLSKLWGADPSGAQSRLESVLANRTKLPELEEAVRRVKLGERKSSTKDNLAGPSQLGFMARMDIWIASSDLVHFDSYRGTAFRLKPCLGSCPGYLIHREGGQPSALVLCKQGSGWRDPAGVARELYEHAAARRHTAPSVWYVFEKDSAVLQHLAELSIWWGGSPTSDDPWLLLAYLTQSGKLEVLFEEYFSNLIGSVTEGRGAFRPNDLIVTGEAMDGSKASVTSPLRNIQPISAPTKHRPYSEVLRERLLAIAGQGDATSPQIDQLLAIDLGL